MRTLFLGLALSLSPLAFAACSGKTIDVGSSEQTGDSGSGEAIAPTPGTSFTASQVQAALGACNQPHGTADAYSTVAGLSSRLVGAWFMCPGTAGSISSDTSAVFGADGSWHRLDSDGNGGLVEGQGLEDTGTYSAAPTNDASDECDPSDCPVTFHGSQGSIEQAELSFETGPRRMLFGGVNWFVPLGD